MAKLSIDDNYVAYQYEVKDFFFNVNGSKSRMKGYELKSLIIVNDYIQNVFPIIQLKVAMDYETYYSVIRNKDDVKVRIRIHKYYMKTADKEESIREKYIDDTFTLILDDDDEDLYEDLREKNNPYKYEDNDTKLHEQTNVIEFYLFRKALIKASKRRINKILKNCNVTTAIAIIMKKMGVNDLLMTPASNIEFYDPLIIPPLRCTRAIQYIDTYYGIHETGSMLFFGVERSYLLKYGGRCTAWEKDEIKAVTIYVPEAGSAMSMNLGSVLVKEDKNRYYLVADPDSIEFSNRDQSTSILKGSDIEVIDSASSSVDNSDSTNNNNKVIVTNRGLNNYFKKIYLKQFNSSKSVITCGFNDIDLAALYPNKKFNFVFENSKLQSKYKGVYILVKSEIGLVRRDADLLGVATCTFYLDD